MILDIVKHLTAATSSIGLVFCVFPSQMLDTMSQTQTIQHSSFPQAGNAPQNESREINFGDCLLASKAGSARAICEDFISIEAYLPKQKTVRNLPEAAIPLVQPSRPEVVRESASSFPLVKAVKANPCFPLERLRHMADDVEESIPVEAGCRFGSPQKSRVIFADRFRAYRGVVILTLGGNRRMVIGGLGAIAVRKGEQVAQGQTLGFSTTTDSQKPAVLYVSYRTVQRSAKTLAHSGGA